MIVVVLHNIRSVYNTASIFRTAEAAGASKAYLTGYTPQPVDRFGRARKDFAKVSLGAEKTLPWEPRRDIVALLARLQRDGITVVAVEQDARALHYRRVSAKGNRAFVFGNEREGLPASVLRRADAIAEIPMRRRMIRHSRHPRNVRRGKESLNVAVAAGIVLFGGGVQPSGVRAGTRRRGAFSTDTRQ